MKKRILQAGVAVAMAAGAWVWAQVPGPEPAAPEPPPQFDTNSEPKVAQAAKINLSPALAEVVRLAQSGADEKIVVAYVEKAPPYTLSADEIIYLQDLGITDTILKALVDHGKSGAVGAVPPAKVPEPTPVAPPAAASPPPAPVAPAATPPSSPPPATAAEFYEPLSPYGTWIIVEPYGWCWQPSVVAVNRGWNPYCDNGYWLWSDAGWYWHSYYSWGWAPFHYGRWFYHPHRRWCWLPDRVWGPSWVCWRESPSYYGWAPLPPGAHFSVGVGWTFGGHSVGPNFAFGLSVGHFTFVGVNHFSDRHLHAHRLPPRQVNVVVNQTKIVNNYVVGSNNRIVNQGVDRKRVESVTGTRVREVQVREMPQQPARAGAVMPDRIAKVGNSDVVYRPGRKIDVPQKPGPTAIGQREALIRQDAPTHRKNAGEIEPLKPVPRADAPPPAVREPVARPPIRQAPSPQNPTPPVTPAPKPTPRPTVAPAPAPTPTPVIPVPGTVPPPQPVKPPTIGPPSHGQPIPARPPQRPPLQNQKPPPQEEKRGSRSLPS